MPSYRPGRRAFLAGVAGATGLAVITGPRSATASFGPRAKLDIDGAKEAVVSDDGTVAYVATTDGFASVDVSDPANPTLLARVDDVTGEALDGEIDLIWDVSVDEDRLLVCGPAVSAGQSTAQGFAVFDVSDPADPQRRGVHGTGHQLHNAFVAGDIAYLTGTGVRGSPVLLFDIAEGEPVSIGSFSPAAHGDWQPDTIHDVYVVDDTMYACYWDLGTWVVDVSDPADPEPLLRVGFDQSADPGTGRGELPGNAHYAQPNPDGDVLAVGKEAGDNPETEVEAPPGGIELWDVTDRSNPSRETVIAAPPQTAEQSTGTAHNFGWKGDRLYVSWNAGGVEVYEVAAAAEPARLAGWRDDDRGDFWTAKPIHDGFVGPTTLTFDEDGPRPGLFTFPEPTGDDPTPVRTMEPLAAADYTATFAEPTATPSARPEPTTEPPRTTAARSTRVPPGDTPSPTRVSTPGFDAVAALAAGSLTAWWLLRGRRHD